MATHYRHYHGMRGTLDEQFNQRLIPHGTGDIIQPHPCNKEICCIKVTGANIQGSRSLGKVLAYGLSRFYLYEGIADPTSGDLVGAFVSIFANLLPWNEVCKTNMLYDALQLSFFEPDVRLFNTDEHINALVAEDARTRSFLHMLEREGDSLLPYLTIYEAERLEQLVICGIILLSTWKESFVSNSASYPVWAANCAKNFVIDLGMVPKFKPIWTQGRIPDAKLIARLKSIVYSSIDLRVYLFRICLAASSSSGGTSNLWKCIVQLLKGAEMTHIILIDRYLYNKYPELLFIRFLEPERDAMIRVWNFLATLPSNDRFFAKILYSEEETTTLNIQNMELYTTAAVAAAEFETSGRFKFYTTNVRATSIKNIVTTYLTCRQKNHVV